MILSVKLTDEMNFSVNFALLSSANKDFHFDINHYSSSASK